jgi:membrane associated rhomboid family serine protease
VKGVASPDPLGLRFLIFSIRVWAALALWVGIQLFGTLLQAKWGAPVAYAAHVGGALTGLVFWMLYGRGETRVLPVAMAGQR